MDILQDMKLRITRRVFFSRASVGIGTAALATLVNPKAKRVIFLHQSGAPSQIELYDYKPKLEDLRGTELPASVRMGQRITGMTSGQDSLPIAPSIYKFHQCGQNGTWISDLLPRTGEVIQ